MKGPSKAKAKVLLALGYVQAGSRRRTTMVGEGKLFVRGQEFARVEGDVVLCWRTDGYLVTNLRYFEAVCLETGLRKRLGLPAAEPSKPAETGNVSGVYPMETIVHEQEVSEP